VSKNAWVVMRLFMSFNAFIFKYVVLYYIFMYN